MIETCRLATTAARFMSVFQEGLQTLAKLRTGGKQTVVVQHVHVTNGGQAVVAGDLTTGGPRTVGGVCGNGGTSPCTVASKRRGKRRAVGHTRGKGRRVKRQRAAADGVAGSTVGPIPEPHEATSMP
jgi:hypothetical protein